MTQIIAVIVTYNPSIPELAEQVSAMRREGLQIIIVDNASTNCEAMTDAIQSLDPVSITVQKCTENLGLAAGQNLGIAEARRRQATHIIFFDQDSIPQPGFLRALLDAETNLESRGVLFSAVGPATYDPGTNLPYPITRYVGPFIQRYAPQGTELVEATFLIASGCLVKTHVLDQVGNMLSDLFIDYIDVEWSLRARSKGLRCYVASGARMSHRIGDARVKIFGRTISAHSPLRRYYLVRNSFLMLRLPYIPLAYKVREIFLNLMRIGVFLYLSDDRSEYLRQTRRAVADGIAGRFGKQA
jgi:rhamnosyltransferase